MKLDDLFPWISLPQPFLELWVDPCVVIQRFLMSFPHRLAISTLMGWLALEELLWLRAKGSEIPVWWLSVVLAVEYWYLLFQWNHFHIRLIFRIMPFGLAVMLVVFHMYSDIYSLLWHKSWLTLSCHRSWLTLSINSRGIWLFQIGCSDSGVKSWKGRDRGNLNKCERKRCAN